MEFKSAPSALMKFSCATHTAHGNSLDTNWRTCVHSGIPFGWLWLSKGTSLDLGGLLKNEEDPMTHLVRVLFWKCALRDFYGSPLILGVCASPLKRTSLAQMAHKEILWSPHGIQERTQCSHEIFMCYTYRSWKFIRHQLAHLCA